MSIDWPKTAWAVESDDSQGLSLFSSPAPPNSTGDDVTLTKLVDSDDVTDDLIDITDHPILTYTYLALLCLTTLIGNVGNTLVIGAVVCDRRLRKESNVFIINLAIADLCVTGFVDLFSIVGVFVNRSFWSRHSVLCHVVGSICLVSCICSLWSITAISINRYVLLCRRHLYRRIFTWRNCFIICGGLWLGGFLLDLPNFIGWGRHQYDMKTMACSWDRTASYSYTVFVLNMFVTLPLIVVLVCNLNIFLLFQHSRKRLAGHHRDPLRPHTPTPVQLEVVVETLRAEGPSYVTLIEMDEHPKEGKPQPPGKEPGEGGSRAPSPHPGLVVGDVQEECPLSVQNGQGVDHGEARTRSPGGARYIQKEMKLAKTLFIVFIVFCIAWTPYALLCLIDFSDRVSKAAYAAAILLAHGSSSFNSVLYAVTNTTFRDGYRLVLSKLHIYLKR